MIIVRYGERICCDVLFIYRSIAWNGKFTPAASKCIQVFQPSQPIQLNQLSSAANANSCGKRDCGKQLQRSFWRWRTMLRLGERLRKRPRETEERGIRRYISITGVSLFRRPCGLKNMATGTNANADITLPFQSHLFSSLAPHRPDSALP